jgi:hypothetical protein
MTDESQLPSNEELNRSLERLDSLEKTVADNKRKIRESRALCAFLVFLLPPLFLTGEIQVGEKISASIKTRDIDAGDLITIFGFGAAALGVIGYDEVFSLLKKSKG